MQEEWKEKAEENGFAKHDFCQEILAILRAGLPQKDAKEQIQQYHDNDIAEAFEELTPEERKNFYHLFSDEEISEIFAYLENVEEWIEEMGSERAADIIEKMDADDAVDLLEELEEDQREELFQLLDDAAQKDIHLIQSYEDDRIGSRMSTNYVSLFKGLSVKQAMKSLIEQAAENDNITTLYALNEDGTFYGAIELRDLVVAREGMDLNQIISTSYPLLYATETIAECIEQLKDYSEDSFPVLNAENQLIGVITANDIIEVVDEEMGEDYAKLAGMTEESDLNETVYMGMKKRLPWLVILLFLGLLVSSVVGVFEKVIEGLTLIVCFQSLILGMAGNAGTQSLAVTIRVLMDEKLAAGERWKLVLREAQTGLLNGMVLGGLAFFFIGLYILFVKQSDAGTSFAISGCIGAALTISMMISSVTGTVVPMFFKAIHIDPAVASGPLITTINDLVAVTVYYGLAWLLLIRVAGV